jgi:4-alpha-glucanotransferase
VCALHPIYIRLDGLTEDATLKAQIADAQKKLNALPLLDYEVITLLLRVILTVRVYTGSTQI